MAITFLYRLWDIPHLNICVKDDASLIRKCALYLCWLFLWRSLPPAVQHLELPALETHHEVQRRVIWNSFWTFVFCNQIKGKGSASWSNYLHCLWLLLQPSGLSLSGSQTTFWMRPWQPPSQLPHVRLSQGWCKWSTFKPTPHPLHFPAGWAQTKPAQKAQIRLASQVRLRPCRLAGARACSADSTPQPQTGGNKNDKHVWCIQCETAENKESQSIF